MYEYRIASIFAHQKDFFEEFSSCNRNFVISPPLTPPFEGGEEQECSAAPLTRGRLGRG